jgi:capsular polysaccharide biosynthesis protein
MELPKFIQLLKKRKYVLLGVPLFAIGITYFLVRKMPDAYDSKATMATGLVDQSEQFVLDDSKNNDQESKINQQFSNIMQMMQLKRVLEQVSYKLIIHDLSSDAPYTKDNKLFKELNKDAKAHALVTFTELYRTNQSLDINISDHRGLKKVLESMGYDDQTLKKKLVIYRSNNSDYVNIEYESPSAELSAAICNVECEESIKYYSESIKKGRQDAVNFLDSILQQKKAVMDNYMLLLKNYKINNRVLNLNEQAKSFYGLLADFETKIELTQKDIASNKGAIENIDAKFNPTERRYMEGALTNINQEIVHSKDVLKQLNDDYITSNFSPRYKAKVDSMSAVLTFQIDQANDKYIHNPLAVKQNLALEKVKLEIGLDIAKYSLNTLQQELAKLNQRFDKLVPHEAVIQSYEQSIDFASKEYIEILKKYNQTALESTLSIHLKQIEKALPGPKLASKKMLLMILAGLISFILCLVVFFVLFYLDDSIGTVKELANKTDITALGYLPMLHHSMLQLQQLWADKSLGSMYYKNLLRDIRYEVDSEIGDHQILLITSMKNGEGKTIFTLSLAYAYSIINKKILVIDGNFTNPSITAIAKPAYYLEDYLSGKIAATAFTSGNAVDIIGTYGTDVSLLEISNEKNIREKLAVLNAHYDIILIEIPALENLNKAKEWIAFGDKVVSVFQALQTITPTTQQFVNYFISLQPKFIGWVLTKTTNDKLKFKKLKKSTPSS